jgi:ADP-ribose pyrophosphatase YjhB (NUDIX family)
MTPSNQPRLGCGAAILRGGQILLIQRRRPPEAGCWGLPGGKVDWLEPVAAAVAREIAEELGLVLGPLALLCVVDQIDPAGGEHWVAPVYRADSWDGEPRLVEPDKHAAFGWFDLDALPEPLTIATRAAVAALA